MTTKTTYTCDRCGTESENTMGWWGCYLFEENGKHGYDAGGFALLCPACSKRALEKPDNQSRLTYDEWMRSGGNAITVPRDPFHCAKCHKRFSGTFGGCVCFNGGYYHFPSCQ